MRFKDRNFPYPVLDPTGKDILGSAFQVVRTTKNDKTSFYVHLEFVLSNETLTQLISDKKACFIVQADCNATFFRNVYFFSELEADIVIPLTDIKREIGLAFFVCAVQNINDYTVTGMDSIYGDTKFSINKGDVLAYAEPVNEGIYDRDSLKKLSSILLVRNGSDGQTIPYVTYDQPKLEIVMPPSQYNLYYTNKTRPSVKATLLTAVVLPALVEAVHEMLISESKDGDSEYNSHLWYQILKDRVGELQKKAGFNATSPFSLAHMILEGVGEQAMREIDNLLNPS